MPDYMKIDINGLIKDLQQSTVEILFEKKDGTNRLMKATLQPYYFKQPLTEQGKKERADFLADGSQKPVQVLHVYDIEENGWRSIRLDKILFIQLSGG